MQRDKEFEDIFFDKKMSYMELFDEGKIDEGIELLKETWEIFTEPKISNNSMYVN